MSIRARGRHRFGTDAKPNDITLTRRNGQWLVSVRLRVPDEACARQRTWDLVPKTLRDRTHVCQHCGHVMPRDQNSAWWSSSTRTTRLGRAWRRDPNLCHGNAASPSP